MQANRVRPGEAHYPPADALLWVGMPRHHSHQPRRRDFLTDLIKRCAGEHYCMPVYEEETFLQLADRIAEFYGLEA